MLFCNYPLPIFNDINLRVLLPPLPLLLSGLVFFVPLDNNSFSSPLLYLYFSFATSLFNTSLGISVAQVTHSFSRRLPAIGLKLRFKQFFPIKVDQLNLNQAKNISMVLLSSPIKI